MAKKRTFDGEVYILYGLASTEKVAEARAKILRDEGNIVIIDQKKTEPTGWLIYTKDKL
jgi:hypothetical protein